MIIGTLALSIVVTGVPVGSFAAEQVPTNVSVNQSISLTTAIEMAKNYNMNIRQITNAKEKAMKGYSDASNGGNTAAGMLAQYNAYKSLYENGAKDVLETSALEMYKAMFGPQPSLSFEQIYDKFVVPSEITPYSVYVTFQGLKLDEPRVTSLVEYQVNQMYYGILSYQHSIELMGESLSITEKKIKELEQKYALGQVSKVSLETEKLTYTKSLQELAKQKKELRALEVQFNGLLGLPKESAVKIVDPGLLKAPKTYTYEELVTEALANRSDLKKSDLEIDKLTFEVKTMSEYIKDPKADKRVDADQRLLSAKLSKMTLENDIRAEILTAYNSFKQAEENLKISSEKVSLSEKQLTKAKQLYKVGYIKMLDLYGVELQLQNSKLSYESAVYTYNKQLDALSRITNHSLN